MKKHVRLSDDYFLHPPWRGALCDEDEGDQVAAHAAHAAGHPQDEEEPGDGGDEAHQDPGTAAEGHRNQEASLAAILKASIELLATYRLDVDIPPRQR